MRAIETYYRGYHFRSRLEARWAVFFDEMDIRWRYETEGFDLPSGERYLPDFFLSIDEEWGKGPGAGSWFEVKGIDPTASELSLLRGLAVGSESVAYLAVGLPSEHSLYAARPNPQKRVVPRVFAEYPFEVPQLEQLEMICNYWALHADRWQLKAAVNAARAARFEHGKHGLS